MAESDIKEKCSACKYFVGSNDILGVCKRFPQYVNKHDADWCGEFIVKSPVENFAQLHEAMPELAEAAEGLMNLSVEPKKLGRKPKNAETPSS